MRGARIRLAGAAALVQVFIGAIPLLNRRRRSRFGMDAGRPFWLIHAQRNRSTAAEA